jgi:thermolysin
MDYQKQLKKFILRDPHFNYRGSDKFETIAYLRGNLTQAKSKSLAGLRKTTRAFLRANASLFGKDSFEKLAVIREEKDPNGGADIVYQQYHGRSAVYSCSINFHFNRKGILDTVRSSLNPKLATVPREPMITAADAAKRAKRKLNPVEIIEVKETLCYYFKGKTYLVWEVHLRAVEPSAKGVPPHWVVYVDAVTGRIIDYYDNTQTMGQSIGSGTGQYSGGPQQINTWDTGVTGAADQYQLLDVTRAPSGPVIRTNRTSLQPSEDANNQWDDLNTTPRAANQGAEVDAHIYAGKVADYLKLAFIRNGWDDQNSAFVSYVHEALTPNGSYWDFGSAHFGDGSGYNWAQYDYLCCDDIVAHEFGHGLTQTTCALHFSNSESGALSESFSDFLAALVTNDWLIGELCWRSPLAAPFPAPAVRNMEDPTNGGHWVPNPPVYEGHQPSYYSQFVLGGDPHINSGIINQFFYLLTHGGTHLLSQITVTGLGKSVMEQLFYRTLKFKLAGNPHATFLDFRQGMIDACLDLYPADLLKLAQVKKAFHAVGIGPDVYVRDQFADSGEEPNWNMAFDSPDIMNFYGSPTINMTDLTLSSSQPLEAGQTNNAFVRLQNRGYSDPTSPINLANPTVNIYLTPGTSFGPFSSWIYLGLMDIGVGYPWFPPGTVAFLDLAIPKESLPPLGHYCMIAVVNDSLDPAPNPSQIATLSDYLDFISNTNNVAFRNMDVVDYQPDVFKWHEFTIGHLGIAAVTYDISFDLDRFVPGAAFYFRGPRAIFDGTNVRGLRLIERDKNDNIYEVLTGSELIKHQQFTPGRKDVKNPVQYGFEELRTNKAFKIKIGYKMPSKDVFKKLGKRRLKEGFQFAMRQFYEDKLLGSVGLKFRQDALELFRGKRQK